jgi:hypothetical protein
VRDLEKVFEKKSLPERLRQKKTASKGNHRNDLCIIQKKRKGWRAEFKLCKKAFGAKNAAEIARPPRNRAFRRKKGIWAPLNYTKYSFCIV